MKAAIPAKDSPSASEPPAVETGGELRLDPGALRLLEMLERQLGTLVERIVERVRSLDGDGAGYAGIPPEELRAAAEANLRLAIQALREQRAPSEEELAQAAAVGELRARQGLPVATLLRGFRIGVREALDEIEGLVAEAQLDASTSLRLTRALWDWIDDVSVELANAHGHVELAMARQDQQQRAAFVHGLVFGSLSPQKLATAAAAFGLELEEKHHALRVRPTAEQTVDRLEQLLQPSRWSPGIVSMVDDDLVAILPRLPVAEMPVPAGVGPPVPLAAINQSFLIASRALEAATAFFAEDDVGEILLRRFVAPFESLDPSAMSCCARCASTPSMISPSRRPRASSSCTRIPSGTASAASRR